MTDQTETLRAALTEMDRLAGFKNGITSTAYSYCADLLRAALATPVQSTPLDTVQSTPPAGVLHETHICRDCGASITVPYASPPLRGWDMPIDGDGLSRWVVPGEEGQSASSSKKPK